MTEDQPASDGDNDELDVEFGEHMDALDDIIEPMRAVAANLPRKNGAHALFKCLEFSIPEAAELMFQDGEPEILLDDVRLLRYIIKKEVIRPSGGLTAEMLEALASVAARASNKLAAPSCSRCAAR